VPKNQRGKEGNSKVNKTIIYELSQASAFKTIEDRSKVAANIRFKCVRIPRSHTKREKGGHYPEQDLCETGVAKYGCQG